MEIIGGIIAAIVGFIIWAYPIYRIAVSTRTHGGEKLAWLLLVTFIFWFAWIFYLLLAPLKQPKYRIS